MCLKRPRRTTNNLSDDSQPPITDVSPCFPNTKPECYQPDRDFRFYIYLHSKVTVADNYVNILIKEFKIITLSNSVVLHTSRCAKEVFHISYPSAIFSPGLLIWLVNLAA